MKRQISTLASMLLLIALVFTFASCDAVNGLFGGSDEHQHTYSEDWSSDETNHWHAATCENGDECKIAVNAQAAHAFGADGKCTVCAYEKPAAPHEHTYADTLTAGETTHWYAATCEAGDECATAKKDEAAHDFTNGVCVCGKEAPAPALGTIDNPIALTIPGSVEVSIEADGVVYYTFTITENKTLKVTLNSNNADIACGSNINELFNMLDAEAEDSVIEISLVAGTYYVAFATADFAAEDYTVSAEFVNKVSPYEAIIVDGTNNVMFSAAEVAADAANRTVRITEAGNYKFASGKLFVASVTDANGSVVAKNDDYSYTLAAGDYTLGFSMLSMFGVQADTACELNVDKQAVVDDDNVIGKIEGENATFTYTATEEGVLTVTLSSAMGGPVDVTFAHGTVSGSIVAGGDSVEIKLKKDEVVTFTVVSDGGEATLSGEWEAKVWDTGLPEGTVNITTLAGDGTLTAPWVITGAGSYYMAAVDDYPGQYITFTAVGNVKLSLTTDTANIYSAGWDDKGKDHSVSLLDGKSVTLIICMESGVSDVLLTVETSEYVPESDSELVVGETAEVFVDANSTTEVTFTITEAGTYIITVLTENGQLANIRFPDDVLENPLTVTFTEDELADFGGSYTITYKVSTTDGAAGYVNIKVEKQTAQEPSNDPITGTGAEEDPFVINAAGNVLISASYGMPVFVTVPAGFTVSLDCDAYFTSLDDAMTSLGTTVTPNAETTYMIFSVGMAGCMGMLTATEAQAEDDSNKLVVGDNAVNVTVVNNYANPTIVTFTATEAGTYVINAADGETNADVCIFEGDWCEFPYTFTLAAGETITFAVCSADVMNVTEDVINLVITKSEGTGDDVEVEPSENYLYEDTESEVKVNSADKGAGKVYAYFTPWMSGEYSFASWSLEVSAVTLNGEAVTSNDSGNYVLTEMETYVVEFEVPDWLGEGTYTVTPSYQYPEGHQENPYFLGYDDLDVDKTAAFNGEETVWYALYVGNTGKVTVTTTDTAATILLTAVFGNELISENGVVSMPVIAGRTYYIGITDFNYPAEARDVNFVVNITEEAYTGDGSLNTPITLVNGSNNASVVYGESVWFVYFADAAGTLTINSDNAVFASCKSDEEISTTGERSFEVYSGDALIFKVTTSDYSSAELVFTASFEAAPQEIWYDSVNIDGTTNVFEIADNSYVGFNLSGAACEAVIAWDNKDAIVLMYGEEVVANGSIVTVAEFYGANITVMLPDYAAGTVNVTITPCVAETTTNALVLGENSVNVTVVNYYCAGIEVTFTAEVAGTYVLSAAEGEANADVYLVTSSSSEWVELPYSFTLEAGETVTFAVATTENMTLTEDVIDLVLTAE